VAECVCVCVCVLLQESVFSENIEAASSSADVKVLPSCSAMLIRLRGQTFIFNHYYFFAPPPQKLPEKVPDVTDLSGDVSPLEGDDKEDTKEEEESGGGAKTKKAARRFVVVVVLILFLESQDLLKCFLLRSENGTEGSLFYFLSFIFHHDQQI